eukprot:CAMPEP_0169281200 /NCGR_PEP_ID=MMETSP1016-20121227/56091_1 /TAXON_ID=342587 /ORGANISM="Karlodinium micrum, Strain CCMP2283" /LENGTH=82 /DNA_ID=CAMNT_0009369731 /DNA_START=82 /DNA_END=327 /DNA_ORIENTATION=-
MARNIVGGARSKTTPIKKEKPCFDALLKRKVHTPVAKVKNKTKMRQNMPNSCGLHLFVIHQVKNIPLANFPQSPIHSDNVKN